MKKFAFILFVFFLLFIFQQSIVAAPESEEDAAISISEQLIENLEISPLNIKIKQLTKEGTLVSSEFAHVFLKMTRQEMKRNKEDFPSVEPLKRSLTRAMITNQNSPDENPEAVTAFLEGNYRIVKDRVILEIRLSGEDGSSISRAETSLPVSAIPHQLEPPNLQTVKQTQQEIDATTLAPSSDFEIDLKLNKEDGATYQEGEILDIFFRSETNSYVQIFYQDALGNRYLIYPDSETGAPPRLQAGKAYNMTMGLVLEISCKPACGTEMVMAFASTSPLNAKGMSINLEGSGFFGYPASMSLTRMLAERRGVKKSTQKAEALVYLTTVPKQ